MTPTLEDSTGHAVVLAEAARRVVSLVPSLSETVCKLGREEALVGITPFCVEPKGIGDRAASVGGPLGVDVDRICHLRPDVVLASREENEADDVLRLRRHGVPVFVVWPRSVAHVAEMLETLGALLGVEEEASSKAAELRLLVNEAKGGPDARVTVTCPVWLEPPKALGTGTYGADLLRLAGGTVVPELPGYPDLDATHAAPEVILLPDEPYAFSKHDVASLGLEDCPAARDDRVHLVDGRSLFWYGVRSAAALAELRRLLGARPRT